MLPVTQLAISRPLHNVLPQNVPKYTMNLNNTNGVKNTVVYNSHVTGQKNTILIAQKSSSGAHSGDKSSIKVVAPQPTIKVMTKTITPSTVSVTNSINKGMTFHSSNSNVKFFTGLPTAAMNSETNTQPSVMFLPQTSNRVAQGYQLVTLTQPISSTSTSVVPKPLVPLTSPSSSMIQSEQSSLQRKQASKSTSAPNVPKYSAVINSANNSVIIGNAPVSGNVNSLEAVKPSPTIHNLNTAAGLQLSMYNHGIQPIVPVAYHAQSTAQSMSHPQQKSMSKPNNKPSGPTKSDRLTSPPPSGLGRQTAPTMPRIYTPSPGSSSALLTELSHDRRTPVGGSSLLIQSSIPQLQGSRTFNPTGQFSHQSFTGDHAGLAALVGLGPGQAGDAQSTIRLHGYQGLPSQRLALYTDPANNRPSYSTIPGTFYFLFTLYIYIDTLN